MYVQYNGIFLWTVCPCSFHEVISTTKSTLNSVAFRVDILSCFCLVTLVSRPHRGTSLASSPAQQTMKFTQDRPCTRNCKCPTQMTIKYTQHRPCTTNCKCPTQMTIKYTQHRPCTRNCKFPTQMTIKCTQHRPCTRNCKFPTHYSCGQICSAQTLSGALKSSNSKFQNHTDFSDTLSEALWDMAVIYLHMSYDWPGISVCHPHTVIKATDRPYLSQ